MDHFNNTRYYEVDIYIDCDKGVFKLCRVGMTDEIYEVQMKGLNKCGNQHGWVPHVEFAVNDGETNIRIAKIDLTAYGQSRQINWN